MNITVIGGGISGLTTAYFISKKLNEFNITCNLIEQDNRFGGKIQSMRTKGFILEEGPDSFSTTKPSVRSLVEELKLNDELITQNRHKVSTYILHKNKLRSFPSGIMLVEPIDLKDLMMNDLLSVRGKIRFLFSVFVKDKDNKDDESLSRLVTRKFGKETLQKIAKPLFTNIYQSDAEKMSVNATIPQLKSIHFKNPFRHTTRKPYSSFSFKNGMHMLCDALQKELKEDHVKLKSGISLMSVTPFEGKYKLSFSDSTQSITDVLVLAIPSFNALKVLEASFSWSRDILSRIQYTSIMNVTLGYKKMDIPFSPGNGFLTTKDNELNITGCTVSSSKFPFRAQNKDVLLRCYMRGDKYKYFTMLPDKKIVDIVEKDLEKILKIKSKSFYHKVFRLPLALPHYGLGHQETVSQIENHLKKSPGLYLIGAAYKGVGIPSCIKEAELTCEKILQYVKEKSL